MGTYAEKTLKNAVYFEALLGALCQIIGSIASLYTIHKYDARLTFLISSILESVVLIAFAVLRHADKIEYYVLWGLFSLFNTPVWNAIDLLQPEAFPTDMRGTAFGFMSIWGRLGGFMGTEIFGFFHKGSLIPVFLCALCFVIGAVTIVALPSKKGQ